MKQYTSISKNIDYELQVYAFDKLDGSNVRAEWNRKNGFYKFGSRKCLIDENHRTLGEAVSLIKTKYGSDLDRIFRQERWDQVTAFFEFFGEHSFAGQHVAEPHKVILIDVDIYKKGILPPSEFTKLFFGLYIPKVLYVGRVNYEFINSVRNGSLQGMTFEGVVCKGVLKKNRVKMFKIKSNAWVEKLKEFCKGNEKLFSELL